MLGPLSRYAPPPGTQLLLALLCGLTLATAWATSALTVMPLLPGSPDAFHPIALLTNAFVAAPVGPGGFILLLALIGFFNQHMVLAWWRRAPQQVLAWTIGPLVLLFVLDRFVLVGYGFGLAADAVLLGWTASAVERIWGQRRLLWFTAILAVVVNGVAALLIWQAPTTLTALAGPGGALPIGAGPIAYGLLTVWCLAQGDRVLAIINAPARKLIIALALLKGLDLIFVGVATGLCGLAGIGVALLLVSGRWDPRQWRKPKPRPRPRLVREDEDRHYHRHFCSKNHVYGTVTRAARSSRAWPVLPEGNTMPRGMIFGIISALLGASALAAAAPVQALVQASDQAADQAPDAPPASATAAYQAGVTHFESQRYAQALAAFEQALRVAPESAVLVFNLARAFEELRAVQPAIEHYQRYLRMRPDAEDRLAVLAAIQRLQGVAAITPAADAIDRGTLTVTSTPAGATVFVDWRPAGSTPLTIAAAVGVHFVTIEQDGFSRASREIAVLSGQATAHSATLVPNAEVVPRGEDDRAGWLLLGFGSTLLIGGGVFGALALDQDHRLDAIEAGDRSATRAEFNDAQDTGRLYAYLADGLLIGGVAAAITGGLVLLTDEPPTRARDAGALAWNF